MAIGTRGQAAGETPTFGDALKRYRRAAGLTQEMLAERAGYSTVYVSMLERGQRVPLPSTLQALADALDLSPRERAGLHAVARIGDRSAGSYLLTGRERELDLIASHLRGDGPPVLLLAGEPGIGKSRLLREAAGWATLEGMTVLSGGCLRRGGQEPYAPLLDVLQRHIREAEPEQLRADLEGCSWLVRLLPEIETAPTGRAPRGGRPLPAGNPEAPASPAPLPDESPLPAWALSAAGEHRLISQALIRFLRNISGPAGTLLLLDDLQWAGSDALDLLALLARSAAETSVRVIGAYRDTEVHARHPLSGMLADLAEAGLAGHCTLSPLSEEATSKLLDELLADVRLPAHVRERALRRAGGVPFFVVSCAQALRLGAGNGEELPWDLAQSVRQRLAALSERAEETLGVAALVGRRIPLGVLVASSGRDEAEILDDVEQACRLRLLEEQGDDAYLFSHDVVREVVEHDLSAARRAFLHRRIGMALEACTPRAVETLAYHFTRSSDRSRAIHYLERAGDTARAQHAAAAAEGYYRELVDRLESMDETGQAARSREKLGDALSILARYDEALEILERAAKGYRTLNDSEGEARTAAQIGRIHSRRGSAEDGLTRLEPLRDHLALGGPSRALAELNVALAPLFLARERYQDQLAAAEDAAGWARTAGDERVLAEAEVWRGCALNQLGRWDEGRGVQEAAVPLCEAANDLTSLSHALNDVAFAHEAAGRFDRSKFYKERALEVAERLGDPSGIANMAFRCGQLAFLQGAWEDARAFHLRALDLSRQVGSSSIAPYPHFGLARLSLAQGDLDEAVRHAGDCLAIAQESQDRQATQAALGLLAECDLARGEAAAARQRLGDLEAGENGLALYSIAPIMAEVILRNGENEAARAWAERSVERAREAGNQVDLIEALRVRALTRAAAGDAEAGVDVEEALTLARRIGYQFGETRILDVAAEVSVSGNRLV